MVAAEVRKLAENSRVMAQEIGGLAATAEQMSNQVQQLQQAIGFFKLDGGTKPRIEPTSSRSDFDEF